MNRMCSELDRANAYARQTFGIDFRETTEDEQKEIIKILAGTYRPYWVNRDIQEWGCDVTWKDICYGNIYRC